MFCEKCGSKIEDGCRFCEKCGAPVFLPAAVQTSSDVNYQQGSDINVAYQQGYDPNAAYQQGYDPNAAYQQGYDPNAAYQQGYDPNAAYQQTPNSGAQKKKFRVSKKLIIIGASVVAVASVALVLLFSKRVKNTINKSVKSEEEYYQTVEGEWLQTTYNDVTTYAASSSSEIFEDISASKYSFDIDFKLTNPDAEIIDEFSDRFADVSWLENVSAAFDLIVDDKKGEFSGEFSLNNETIADYDLILDLAKEYIYAGIPMLTEKYLMADISSAISSRSEFEEFYAVTDTFKEIFPNEQDYRIIDKYLDIITSKLVKVSLSDSSVTAGGVTQECTRAVVNIDEKVQESIVRAIVEEAIKDTDLKNFIMRMENNDTINPKGIDLYDRSIAVLEELLDKMDSEDFDPETNFNPFKMTVSIDSKGEVIGREFKDEDGIVIFSYAYAIDGSAFGFKAFTERRNGDKDIEITISNGTVSGDRISGTLKLEERSNELFKVEIEDVDVSGIFDGKFSGTVILDLYKLSNQKMFKGIDLRVSVDTSSDNASIKLEVTEDDKGFAELSFGIAKKSSESISTPSKTVELDLKNPVSDISDWYDSLEWKNMLKAAKAAKLPEEALEILEKLTDSDFNDLFKNINGFRNSTIF